MESARRHAGPPILRQGHPLAFAQFLEHVGAPAQRLLGQQGLAVYNNDPAEFVRLHRAWAFFDTAARNLSPDLGWHVGRFVGDHNLSSRLLDRLRRQPTLYEALKDFARLASSEASHVHLGVLERSRDILFFSHYPTMKEVPGYHLSQGYQMGILVDVVRHFAGRSWVPEEMGIESREVPEVAKEMFPGCRILAEQRLGYIVVPRAALPSAACTGPVAGGEERPFILTREFDFAETLGALLQAYLPAGYPSAVLAASLVDVSVATLARRLADCGTSYRALVDRVRFRAAKELLETTDMRVTDIAIAVGFDDSSNFARMFRRIGGMSPRHYRALAID